MNLCDVLRKYGTFSKLCTWTVYCLMLFLIVHIKVKINSSGSQKPEDNPNLNINTAMSNYEPWAILHQEHKLVLRPNVRNGIAQNLCYIWAYHLFIRSQLSLPTHCENSVTIRPSFTKYPLTEACHVYQQYLHSTQTKYCMTYLRLADY